MPHRASSAELAAFAEVAATHLREVAAELVRPTLGRPARDVRWMTSTQVHTEHDALAGAALEQRFLASFPRHGLVVEDRPPLPGDGVHEWHIDPIDGSANHLRGIPYVSLTAGLLRDGEPVVGVIHDLLRDHTLVAHRGGGAVVHRPDGRRELRLRDERSLRDAMAILHLARRGPLLGREGALPRLIWSVRKIRCMGSIALDLALLAAGEADLLLAGRGKPQRLLDVLGGLVILREAGGQVGAADGGPLTATSRTLLAGPPDLCGQVVELMADLDLEGWRAEDSRAPSRPHR